MLPKVVKLLWSPRMILSVLTVVVLVLIIYLTRDELVKARALFLQADLRLLALLIPFQIVVYYAGGEMIFSYLREKKLIKHISHFETTRIALELNLVNHIFPSGGVSGISYTSWRMSKMGVSSARSTFAQVIRYVTGFFAMLLLLVLSVLILTIDGQVNRYIVAASFLLILGVLALTFGLMFMFSSKRRMQTTASFVARSVNWLIKIATLGKRKRAISSRVIEEFFADMQDDFQDMANHPKTLIKPFVWGVVYTTFDVLMFVAAFLSLGVFVNPAILMVGYGVATLAGTVAFTPGGAGVYEAIMIVFLSMAGTPPDLAIAGIILARAILLTGTIIFGYIFYQHALIKYGKPNDTKV